MGYSHGAAIATLVHEYIFYNRPDLRENLWGYGFGCPRCFWGFLPSKEVQGRWARFFPIRSIDDLVTHLPPAVLWVPPCAFGIYRGQKGKIPESGGAPTGELSKRTEKPEGGSAGDSTGSPAENQTRDTAGTPIHGKTKVAHWKKQLRAGSSWRRRGSRTLWMPGGLGLNGCLPAFFGCSSKKRRRFSASCRLPKSRAFCTFHGAEGSAVFWTFARVLKSSGPSCF